LPNLIQIRSKLWPCIRNDETDRHIDTVGSIRWMVSTMDNCGKEF